MKKTAVLLFAGFIGLTSCVSKKKYAALEADKQEVDGQLSNKKMELASCLDRQKQTKEEIAYLKSVNYKLLNSVDNLSTLSSKEAENLERSLESISEKERQIKSLQEAKNKQDSVTYALAFSLKGELGMMSDEDVQISVDGGVVYVNISDRMLFKSGSAQVAKDAYPVIEKVAKIVNNQEDMDVMVEGHTDNKAMLSGKEYLDNWELSCQRASSVVRVLENDYNVAGSRLVAAGRSSHVPLASNDDKEGRAKNRRTRIVLLPKLDQFYELIEEGMEEEK